MFERPSTQKTSATSTTPTSSSQQSINSQGLQRGDSQQIPEQVKIARILSSYHYIEVMFHYLT